MCPLLSRKYLNSFSNFILLILFFSFYLIYIEIYKQLPRISSLPFETNLRYFLIQLVHVSKFNESFKGPLDSFQFECNHHVTLSPQIEKISSV